MTQLVAVWDLQTDSSRDYTVKLRMLDEYRARYASYAPSPICRRCTAAMR